MAAVMGVAFGAVNGGSDDEIGWQRQKNKMKKENLEWVVFHEGVANQDWGGASSSEK